MITITGGKLTTWRRMAKMTVDRLVERDARDAPCRTHEIPLGQAIAAEELPRVEGVPEESYAALAGRYGHAAHDVLAIAAERGELAQPIVPGPARTCSPRSRWPRAASRRAASATCCCAAPAWGCSPPATASSPERGGRREPAGARVADVLARELGWDASAAGPRSSAFFARRPAPGASSRRRERRLARAAEPAPHDATS